MAPECHCAGARPAVRTPVRVAWGALVPGLAMAVLPKCPLCLAGYLSVLGLGAGTAGPWLRVLHPASLVVAAVALGVVVTRLARRARAARRYRPLVAVAFAAGIAFALTLAPGAAVGARIAAIAGLAIALAWASEVPGSVR
jgi:hypothetical protein